MFCISCGKRIGKTARFCPKCGADQTIGTPQVEVVVEGTPAGAPIDVVSASATAFTEIPQGQPAFVPQTVDADATAQVQPTSDVSVPWTASPVFAPLSTPKNKMIMAAVALSLVVVAVLGAVVVAQIQTAQRHAQALTAAQIAKEHALVSSFDGIMKLRQQALVAEASINNEVTSAKAKRDEYWLADGRRDATIKANKEWFKDRTAEVTEHNDAENRVYQASYYEYMIGWTTYYAYRYTPDLWDYPSQREDPKPVASPSLGDEAQASRKAVAQLTEVLGTLNATTTPAELSNSRAQLVDVVKMLIDAGNHNTDVLTTAVKGKTTFDARSISTLRKGSGSPLFAKLNDTALAFIGQHKLDIRVYDVAGGRDSSPYDSSMLTASTAR